jgi:hypothetical protein
MTSQTMVFRSGDRIPVAAGGRGVWLVILGGAPLSGPRYIWVELRRLLEGPHRRAEGRMARRGLGTAFRSPGR